MLLDNSLSPAWKMLVELFERYAVVVIGIPRSCVLDFAESVQLTREVPEVINRFRVHTLGI